MRLPRVPCVFPMLMRKWVFFNPKFPTSICSLSCCYTISATTIIFNFIRVLFLSGFKLYNQTRWQSITEDLTLTGSTRQCSQQWETNFVAVKKSGPHSMNKCSTNVIRTLYIQHLRRQLYRYTAIHNSSPEASWDRKVFIGCVLFHEYQDTEILLISWTLHLLFQGGATPVLDGLCPTEFSSILNQEHLIF